MPNISKLKLGKKAPKFDPRTLQLAKYTAGLPPPPVSCDWTKGIASWGEMLNDTLGDCTCAAVGHGAQIATLNSPSGESTPGDNLILNLYENACGYVPSDPSTDQGGVIVDVLNYIRQNGFGHKFLPFLHRKYDLIAYADPIPGDITHIKQGIQLFGVVDIGLQLPITAQLQVGGLWNTVGSPSDPSAQPGSWGGHSVSCVAYDATTITCITWGALQKMTWSFWSTYVDESHALLYRAWLQQFESQNPMILTQLEQDLVDVTD